MEAPPATGRLAPPGQRRKLPTDRDANGKMPQRPLLQPLACKGLAQEWAGTFVNPPLFDPDKVDASEARASNPSNPSIVAGYYFGTPTLLRGLAGPGWVAPCDLPTRAVRCASGHWNRGGGGRRSGGAKGRTPMGG